jgi:hypothetical protein
VPKSVPNTVPKSVPKGVPKSMVFAHIPRSVDHAKLMIVNQY